ncbi:hypothetical protein B0H21DRAFT_186256 [Amylocystis lapponica]|nr:hypothetical protein B0H21DRAFT_186256 [Amylocystis lapponica]
MPTEVSANHAESSSSSGLQLQSSLCAICATDNAKYTCPRCSIRICSLSCSTEHKARGQGCSGVRNKAAYVPMNQYGYMALMDDYVFLEEVGRNVGGWGREIVQGGYLAGGGTDSGRGRMAPRGRGRGRGRGAGGHAGGKTRSKRDVLKMQLDFRDIEMDLLPNGMERRTLNQSTWDFKNRSALLTVEFIFHPSPDPLAPHTQQSHEPYTLVTHRNDLDKSLFSTMQSQIAERSKAKKDKALPAWVRILISPDPDDPDAFTPPMCVMRTPVDPLAALQIQPRSSLHPGHLLCEAYYKLDPSQPLGTVLKHKHFVEFPTVEVWEESAFHGTIVDDQGAVQLESDGHRPKRRKLNARQGKKAISGLLGGYGSEEEPEDTEEQNVMNMLGGYAGSGDEDEGHADDDAQGEGPEVNVQLDDDGSGDEVEHGAEDLAVLLDKLRQAGALRNPAADRMLAGFDEDEEQLDWGESGDEDDEG